MFMKIISRIFKPYVILPLLMVGLFLAWNGYIDQTNKNLNKAKSLNYIADSLLTNGSFENLDASGRPTDWAVAARGALAINTQTVRGYQASNHGLRVDVADYTNGLVTISSAKVAVEPQKKYFFKTFYLTDTEVDLLVRYYYEDGSQKLVWLQNYPDFDHPWSTLSAVIQPDNQAKALSMVLRISAKGYIELDNAYLIESAYLNTRYSCQGENLISNPDTNIWDRKNDQPANWRQYQDGLSTTSLTSPLDGNNHFLRIDTKDYESGGARWKHRPVAVGPHQQFCLTFDYRSQVSSGILIEYTLQDKKKQFIALTLLQPTDDWTRRYVIFETPAGAKDMIISLSLKTNGQLDSGNYNLVRLSDSKTFNRSLISISFDDGWKSSYVKATKSLEQHKMSATFYINPGALGLPGFITEGDLKDLQRRHFHLASHGINHVDMTSINTDWLKRELTDSKEHLIKKLGLKTVDFATPYGKHDPQTDFHIQSTYVSHRGTDEGINTKLNFDSYNLQVLFIHKNTQLSYLKQQLEAAKASNGWLILVYHEIDNDDNKFSVSSETFEQQLQAIGESSIPVLTVRQALQELQAQL